MPKYKFTEIAINSTEKKKPTEADKDTYIGLEHLDSGTLTVSRWGAEVAPIGEKLVMKKGDVLFGKRRAYQKKVGIAPFDGIFSAHGMVLRPREEVITKEYFPLFISSDYFLNEAIRISVGSLSPTVNWKDLKDLEFFIPSIEEQRRLTPVVWAAIEARNAYKTLISRTDELVKSQFIELTEGARTLTISEVCSRFGRGKSPNYVTHSEIKVINQACIYWDGLRLKNVKFQDKSKFKPDNQLVAGAVLLNATGTGTLGRSYVFEELEGIFMADSHVAVFYPNVTLLMPRFLQVFFSLPTTQETIYADCVNGSTNQIELSREKIALVRVPVPRLEQQQQFVMFVQQSDKSKFELQEAIARIDNLIKSLIQQDTE